MRRARRLVSLQAGKDDVPEDSSDTQDALVDMLRSNINRVKAIEKLDGVTDAEKMKLIERADDVSSACARRVCLNTVIMR